MNLILNKFHNLEDGWYNGVGLKFNKHDLNWLENLWNKKYSKDIISPTFFPTLQGNVMAEWSTTSYEISLEVNLKSKYSEFQVLNKENLYFERTKLNLENHESWNLINKKLSSILK